MDRKLSVLLCGALTLALAGCQAPVEEPLLDPTVTVETTAVQAGEIFDLSDYAVLSAPFQLAAAEQDGPKALELLDRLLRSLTVPWDLSASPLYPHLPTKDAAEESQRSLIPVLLDGTARDPDCAFLREMPEYGTMVEKYRRAADEA